MTDISSTFAVVTKVSCITSGDQKNYFAYMASDKSNSFYLYRQKLLKSFYFFKFSVMVNKQPSQVNIVVCQESITTKRLSDSYISGLQCIRHLGYL